MHHGSYGFQHVYIPKKGNLSSYDNWRGIALLGGGVVGKVAVSMIQGRLDWQRENYQIHSVDLESQLY